MSGSSSPPPSNDCPGSRSRHTSTTPAARAWPTHSPLYRLAAPASSPASGSSVAARDDRRRARRPERARPQTDQSLHRRRSNRLGAEPRRSALPLDPPNHSSQRREHMSNRVAFVTGGAQGIGQGISETLGANGFRVAVADLNLEAAEATAKRITDAGGEAIAVHVDVTDTESVRGAVKTVSAELGDIEIVVNNAGWDDFMPFLKTSEDFWDKIIDINFKGALRVI